MSSQIPPEVLAAAVGSAVTLPAAAPPEEQAPQFDVPLHSGIRRLFTSAKALVAGSAVIGVIVMNVMGKIDGPKALDFITYVLVAYFGAHAVEDGAEKLSGGKPQPPPDYAAYMNALAQVLPVFSSMLKSFRGEDSAPTPGPRYAPPLEAMRPRSKDEIEADLKGMLAEEPSGTVVPFGPRESPEKPPTAS